MLFDIPDLDSLSRLVDMPRGQLAHLASRVERYYRPKSITKPDGTSRLLLVPRGELRWVQKKIKKVILDRIPWMSCVYGGVRGKSAKSNAAAHAAQPVVFTLDIKSFFPSVTPERVSQGLQQLGFGERPARILARLTTFKHQLPQGTHTSTALANLALTRADLRIRRLASMHGFTYTRFVDDLSLSGGRRLYKFRKLVIRIIEDEGFQIKLEKKHTMPAGTRQVVTKLVVNTKVNLTRERRKEIREEVLTEARRLKGVLSGRTKGRLAWLSFVNPEVGSKLRDRIREGAARG
jgi:RNA-directed DNA polymerase